MPDNKSNDIRRKLLKSIVAGSGAVVAGKSLPESWSKPVIDTVLLPVHALTTDCCEITGTYCGLMTSTDTENDSRKIPIEIIVTADGLLTIDIDNGQDTGSVQTSCLGGEFTVLVANSGGDSLTGTVGCGLTDITGSFWEGTTNTYSYTASVNGC